MFQIKVIRTTFDFHRSLCAVAQCVIADDLFRQTILPGVLLAKFGRYGPLLVVRPVNGDDFMNLNCEASAKQSGSASDSKPESGESDWHPEAFGSIGKHSEAVDLEVSLIGRG